MDQSNLTHYEIQDTGTEVKNGAVIYPRVQEEYLKLYGSNLSPQIEYMIPEYQAPLKDRVNNKWDFTSKRVVGKNPLTFNLTLYFKSDKYSDMAKLFQMADNYGIKRIKGGNGIISNLPFAETDGSAFCLITRISPSESASRPNIIQVTLSGVFI